MTLRLSPARFIAVVSALFTMYSTARVGVLFFEALSIVRAERAEDYELLELCQRGDARGSTKMREACLKARAELASPVVFKAIVHAVSVAFKDFSDTVGSPLKLFVCCLFIISSVMLPIVPWARAFFGTHASEVVSPYNGMHFISYAPPPDRRGRFRRKMSNAMRRLKLRSGPTIEEPGDSDDDDVEPGVEMTSTKPLGAAYQYHDATDCGSNGAWTTIDMSGAMGGAMSGLSSMWNRPGSPHHKRD